MAAWRVLLFLAAAVLSSIKSIYGLGVWRGSEVSFSGIWRSKPLYGLTAIWFLVYIFIWDKFGQSLIFIRIVDLWCTYMILAIVDIKRRIVPDEILAAYFVGQMLLGTGEMSWMNLLQVVLTGTVFTVILFAVTRFSSGKIGLGDVKLLWATAMTAGWVYTLQILIWGMGLSFLYSMGLLFIAKKNLRSEFPFVPFLAAGIGIQMFV